MIFLKYKGKEVKVLGIIELKNTGRYDQTDIEVLAGVSKIIKKYGKIEVSLIDEYGNLVSFQYFNDKPVSFEEWNGKRIIIKVNKITAKEKLIIFVTEKVEENRGFLEYGFYKSYRRKVFFGSRIEIIEKIPWKEGHSQSLVRLGDYLYIATVYKDEKVSYIYKLNLKDYKIEDYVKLKFGSRYHISGISDDKSNNFFYVAIAEYRPKVEKPTIILKVYPDLSYEKFIEVKDHIGAIAADKKRLYLFNWDAEKLYIYSLDGKFIKTVDKKGWGPVQDCDYSYGKIYGTAQNMNRIDVIETRTFNVINRIYTPKGLTNEGFDIDNVNPTIFWFLPDDGYIYKTKYTSISGYIVSIKSNNGKLKLKVDNNEYRLLLEKDYLRFQHVIDGKIFDEYKIKKDNIVKFLVKIERIIIYFKDVRFNYGLIYLKNKEASLEIENAEILIRKYSKKIKCTTYVL